MELKKKSFNTKALSRDFFLLLDAPIRHIKAPPRGGVFIWRIGERTRNIRVRQNAPAFWMSQTRKAETPLEGQNRHQVNFEFLVT